MRIAGQAPWTMRRCLNKKIIKEENFMQKLKKPVSILLVFMMIVSLFAVVPITASAAAYYGTYELYTDATKELKQGDQISGRYDPEETEYLEADYVTIVDYNTGDKIASRVLEWTADKDYEIIQKAQSDISGDFEDSFDSAFVHEYTFTIREAKPKYTITWKLDYSTVIDTTQVEKGVVPTHADPTKPEDENYTYTFAGWTDSHGVFYAKDATLPEVTANETYTAVFELTIASVTVGGTTTEYTDFATAVNNWNSAENGATLTLLADVTTESTISVSGTKTLDLNGFTIRYTGSNGSVMQVNNANTKLTVDDSGTTGAITGGNTTGNGGGVQITAGTFELKNGSIEGNIAGNGGGVSLQNSGNFIMSGGTIRYNCGYSYTGGVLVLNNNFTMTGGAIQYNVGKVFGGIGIADSQPNMSGTPVVEGNVFFSDTTRTNTKITKTDSGYTLASGGTPSDIRHATANGLKINIVGALENGAQIGIFNNSQTAAFTNGYKTYNPNDDPKDYFFSNDGNRFIMRDPNKEAQLGRYFTVTWKAEDGTVLETDENVVPGTTPEFNGTIPEKPEDANYTYTFTGWTPEIVAAAADTSYTATFKKTAKKLFAAHSITLGGDIGVNFYINSTYPGMENLSTAETATVKFTWDSEYSAEVDLKALTPDDNGWYKATCNVVAAQMAHKIHAEVYVNGQKFGEDYYSVQDYAETVYNDPASVDPEIPGLLKALVKAMLNYGAEAQTVFDSDLTEHPALPLSVVGQTDFSGIDGETIGAAINGKAFDVATVEAALNAKFYTSSLIYLSQNTLRLYFTPASKTVGALDGKGFSGDLSKYYYYVDVADIAAVDLNEQQTFTVGDKTFTFSALDYAKAVVESTKMEPEQKDLARSLYLYNQAARAYFYAATGVTLNKTRMKTATGAEETLTATVAPVNVFDPTLTWTSSDESIATVDENGKVTGVSPGVATITAASIVNPNVKATCEVGVLIPVEYLDYNTTSQEFESKIALCLPVTENTTALSDTGLSDGWYAVIADTAVFGRIGTSGAVNLILVDGKTLSANNGVNVGGANSLNIYAQSAGDDQGILNATSNTIYSAGIGGNFEVGGAITINGGTITAIGCYHGAGIGGGQYGAGGTITINGGTVTATGSANSAGIGGGQDGAGGTVIINGGTVAATGGDCAAGIGGGVSGNGGTVIINGGTVTAKGYGNGAGIGGGQRGTGGTVTINGGTVTATGDYGGAGIGGGIQGAGATVTVNGGKVIARGSYTIGIGAGYSNSNHGTLTVNNGLKVYKDVNCTTENPDYATTRTNPMVIA